MSVLELLLPPRAWRVLLPLTALVLMPGGKQLLANLHNPLLVFACCGLGLLPVAVSLSRLVEQLVDHLGARLGGLASIVLGNMVELLISLNALSSGLYPLVVTSIVGSVLINCLPVLGLGIAISTRGGHHQAIDEHGLELKNHQLLMSAILLALPSVFFRQPLTDALQGNESADAFSLYSSLVAVLALAYYMLAFLVQPRPTDSEPPLSSKEDTAPLQLIAPALALITVLVALISERLVDALEAVVVGEHLSELFVGLFLLPLFGCLPEMLITIRAAARRQMQLVMINTVDSSLQLLLFVLPLLVLVGLPMGRHLHLGLPPVALAALAIAVVMIERITDNRKLNSYEGLQLNVLFAAMALGALLLGQAR